MHDSDPEGKRLPIKLDSTSNGEFALVPLWPANVEANRLAYETAATNAKRLGCSKRVFLRSFCGAESTLLAFNSANAAAGRTGGFLRAKIFGLNAATVYGLTPTDVKRYTASDSVARKRVAYLEKPDPHFRTYGPKTRRGFLTVFDPAGPRIAATRRRGRQYR